MFFTSSSRKTVNEPTYSGIISALSKCLFSSCASNRLLPKTAVFYLRKHSPLRLIASMVFSVPAAPFMRHLGFAARPSMQRYCSSVRDIMMSSAYSIFVETGIALSNSLRTHLLYCQHLHLTDIKQQPFYYEASLQYNLLCVL